ncbi:MAG: hypothetical protein ACE5EF_09260 [Dehalococcoidia bacterium]
MVPTAIIGLSPKGHSHTLRAGDVELHAPCALDPLLIVPALEESVEIRSADPVSGEVPLVPCAGSVTAFTLGGLTFGPFHSYVEGPLGSGR